MCYNTQHNYALNAVRGGGTPNGSMPDRRHSTSNHTPEPNTFKTCSQCGTVKPATYEYFYRARANKDGLSNPCIECRSRNAKGDPSRAQRLYKRSVELHGRETLNAISRETARRNPERKREVALASYYRHRDEILARQKKLRAENAKKKREWLREHPKLPRIRTAEEIEESHELRKNSSKRYRKRHPDRIKAQYARYQRNNLEKIRAKKQRRTARLKSLPATFAFSDWQCCLDYFDNRCAVCGRPRGFWHTIAMDHWIPLSNPICPGTIPTNIIPLCHALKDGTGCNNSKNNRDPVEWLTEKFGKRKANKILKRIQAYFDSLKDRS